MAPRFLAAALVALALVPAHAGARGPAKAASLATDERGAERALAQLRRLEGGRGVRTGREATHALRELALRLPALDGPERRDGESRLARPTDRGGDPFGDGYPAEAPVARICRSNICVHYVTSGAFADAPPGGLSYANQVLETLEEVQSVEQGQLGWRAPSADGGLGGGPEIDAYVKQLGGQGIFGYAATDPGQGGNSRHGFLVLDNDYTPSEFPGYASPLDPLRVTAAHEYNHLSHYAIDTLQDFWLFESSAVWMEDRVYDAVDDYLNYLPPPRWTTQTRIPLTRFNASNGADPGNIKVYGSAVWNHWLAARFGPQAVRSTW
ncbi:MAG TPA: MXAN_6640 family putative metalloprotease, partial [Thermoleophilaceae bacterium]|nr:MXAN_6640 family putative metalloprotease [Thermoleophilaceae bacterium]